MSDLAYTARVQEVTGPDLRVVTAVQDVKRLMDRVGTDEEVVAFCKRYGIKASTKTITRARSGGGVSESSAQAFERAVVHAESEDAGVGYESPEEKLEDINNALGIIRGEAKLRLASEIHETVMVALTEYLGNRRIAKEAAPPPTNDKPGDIAGRINTEGNPSSTEWQKKPAAAKKSTGKKIKKPEPGDDS